MFQLIPLKRNKIYIIPTRVGAYFIGASLIVLLVGSGYSNNLVNLLAFFMLSLVFAGMILTHLQLKDLKLESLEILPAHAGHEQIFAAVLSHPSPGQRAGINLESIQKKRKKVKLTAQNFRFPARHRTRVSWTEPAPPRGLYVLDRLELNSIYPLGLFYTWKLEAVKLEYWVYPELKGKIPLPLTQVKDGREAVLQSSANHGDEFRGHRDYRLGDSARHIDWKAFARGRPMMVKEINEGDKTEIALDWSELESRGLNYEECLSQLTVWVTSAYARNLPFRLILPNQPVLSGSDERQLRHCLQTLAQLGREA